MTALIDYHCQQNLALNMRSPKAGEYRYITLIYKVAENRFSLIPGRDGLFNGHFGHRPGAHLGPKRGQDKFFLECPYNMCN